MPYEVIADEVTVPKANDVYKDDDGKVTGYDTVARTYFKGDVLEDDDVHPVVVKAYEDGDEHTRSILNKVGKAKADEKKEDDNG